MVGDGQFKDKAWLEYIVRSFLRKKDKKRNTQGGRREKRKKRKFHGERTGKKRDGEVESWEQENPPLSLMRT